MDTAPRCYKCGAEYPVDEAFVKVPIFFSPGTALFCPSCFSKKSEVGLPQWLLTWALFGALGLYLVSSRNFALHGWGYLNLFLVGLFMMLTIAPHEFAHAFTALLLRMRVFRVTIGCGRMIHSSRLLGFELEIRAFPLGGATWATGTEDRFYRLKQFLVSLAGPLADVVMVAIAFAFFKPHQLTEWLSGGGLLPAQAFLLATVWNLVRSLWPREVPVYGQLAPNDSLALCRIPRLSESDIQYALAFRFYQEGGECLQRRQYRKAEEWFRKGLEEHPMNSLLLIGLGDSLVDEKDLPEAREAYLRVVAEDGIDKGLRTLAMNDIAYTDLLMGRKELLEEANRFSKQAYEEEPNQPAYSGTRGAVLVELGQYKEGLALLKESMRAAEDARNKALNACHIALGEARKGNMVEAKRYLAAARMLDSECILLKRVGNEMEAVPSGRA